MVHTTTNQKHAGVADYGLCIGEEVRPVGGGGAHGVWFHHFGGERSWAEVETKINWLHSLIIIFAANLKK